MPLVFVFSGAYAAIAGFLLFGILQFRDGPFIRPHPGTSLHFMHLSQLNKVRCRLSAFWRLVLGINLLYELALVFLLFQDLDSARAMMVYIDPSLGKPLPEKSYAENCDFTPTNVWVGPPSVLPAAETEAKRFNHSSSGRVVGYRTPSTSSVSHMRSDGLAKR